MGSFIDVLAANPMLLLFTVIGLGYLIGNVRAFGFKLGVAAVLFVGIAFGAIDPRLSLPDHIYILGLILFVYALGLQAGPGFFASFHKRGIRFSVIAVVLLSSGALVAILVGKLMGLNAPSIAGLFCGALTNTPALAAAVETIKNLSSTIPADQVSLYINSPVVTYGLAYPFGVFGVIFWFFLFGKIFKVDYSKEAADRTAESTAEAIVSRTYRITNPAVIGKPVEQALAPLGHSGFALSRIKKGERIEIVTQTTMLELGDLIIAVGPAEALEMAHVLFGEESAEGIAQQRDDTSYRLIFVSNKSIAGKSVRELQASRKFVGSITRLRRGEIEFVPSLDTILELGDRIMVVTPREQVEQVSKFFGDSVRALSETDFLSLSLGIVLGVFLGMIPFPLWGGMNFRLGFAGGPLIVGIILGRLERTGPIQWGLPYNANLVLRQTGLVFFLAAIGTKAGPGFGATFQTGAWGLFVAGALITSFVTVSTIIYAYKRLKLPMSAVMGMMSGIQTQPACLAYANQQSDSDLPNLWYATVQPASMIAKITLAQIVVSSLLVQ
jgi:putative transport protein